MLTALGVGGQSAACVGGVQARWGAEEEGEEERRNCVIKTAQQLNGIVVSERHTPATNSRRRCVPDHELRG